MSYNFVVLHGILFYAKINPISGRLLATPISGKGGCLGPPLISPVLTGRFLKLKRRSFRLNMIYISKKKKFQKFVEGGIGVEPFAGQNFEVHPTPPRLARSIPVYIRIFW